MYLVMKYNFDKTKEKEKKKDSILAHHHIILMSPLNNQICAIKSQRER